MAECYRCPYMYNVLREYGITNHCGLSCDRFDVTYYCQEPNQNKENIFCPLVNISIRFPKIDYRFKLLKTALDEYENDILTARRKNNK